MKHRPLIIVFGLPLMLGACASSLTPSSETPSSETPSSETPSSEVGSSIVTTSVPPSSEVVTSTIVSSEEVSSEVSSETALVYGTELFISEYVDGPGTNKALELFNPTDQTIDLSAYKMKLFANGRALDAIDLLVKQMTGTLAPHETFVFHNVEPTGDSGLLAAIAAIPEARKWKGSYDTGDIIANMNGDDALGLFKNDVLIDVFGTIGHDPGTSWSTTYASGLGHTADAVLHRVPTVLGPYVGTLDVGGILRENAFAPLEWNYAPCTAIPITHTIGTHIITGPVS